MLINRIILQPQNENMEYSRIVAVTGLPGLYEVVSSKTDGAIVKSLEDQSTKFISSRIHNLSHLESIEVYTTRENVTLADVFLAMKESGTQLPDVKDNKALKSYFEKVFPEMDFDRVYSSDQKKMVKWFEVLQQNQVDFTVKPEEETEEEEEAQVAEEKPVKKETAKKEMKESSPSVQPSKKEAEKKEPAKKESEKKEKTPVKKAATAKKAAPKKAAKSATKKSAKKK
jgi:outer membrane biosynthesis protein TonB